MTHSPSEPTTTAHRHTASLAAVAVVAVLIPALGWLGALVTTDRFIVTDDRVLDEDQYVTATSGIVEGTIDGDLTIFSGNLTISGTVTGSVNVYSSGTVTIERSGRVGGSLNGAALSVIVEGTVDGDAFFTAGSFVVEEPGSVGRDVMAFGGTSRFEGAVGRDVRGRTFRTTVDGAIGGDVDIATTSLSIGPTADIGGDVLYRSSGEAGIDPAASIGGTVTRLPAQSNFIVGIILSLANLVGFLGFLVAGLVALWLLRGTGSRAVGSILTRPIRSLLVGLVAVLALPFVIVLLAITLVGIPLAVVVIALAVVALVLGPVPAVAALGNRVLLNRGGLFGAFVVGAVLWRLGIWLIPLVGAVLYVVALVWGIGAWMLGALASRRADPTPAMLMPPSIVAREEEIPEWEPPRAPGFVATPPSIAEGPEDIEDVDEATVAEASPEAASEPDPAVERDPSLDDRPVTFGNGEDPSDPEPADPEATSTDTGGTLEERLAAFRTELEGSEEDDTTPELAEPEPTEPEPAEPEAPDEESRREGPPRDDWGLPST